MKLFVTVCTVALSSHESFPRHPWYRCFGWKEQALASVLEEQRVAVGLTGVLTDFWDFEINFHTKTALTKSACLI